MATIYVTVGRIVLYVTMDYCVTSLALKDVYVKVTRFAVFSLSPHHTHNSYAIWTQQVLA